MEVRTRTTRHSCIARACPFNGLQEQGTEWLPGQAEGKLHQRCLLCLPSCFLCLRMPRHNPGVWQACSILQLGVLSLQTIWRQLDGARVLVTEGGKRWQGSENSCQLTMPKNFQRTPHSPAGSHIASIWLESKPLGCRPEEGVRKGSSRKSQDRGSRNSSFSLSDLLQIIKV